MAVLQRDLLLQLRLCTVPSRSPNEYEYMQPCMYAKCVPRTLLAVPTSSGTTLQLYSSCTRSTAEDRSSNPKLDVRVDLVVVASYDSNGTTGTMRRYSCTRVRLRTAVLASYMYY